MIKNIIFDFGDIFINLDKLATHRALSKLGLTTITADMTSMYHQYEMGCVSTEKFVHFFHLQTGINKSELIRSWNAILLDAPKERLQFLYTLAKQKKYRLFLLSNTNDLHISWIQKDWGAKLYNEFKSSFEQFYLSHKINLRKPNKNIYEFVLQKNNLLASETLFIDDTKENTDSAKELGLWVWNLLPEKEDITQLFNKNFPF